MTAHLSEDGLYRYSLTREVAPLTGEGTVTFIGLNPSTADAAKDDATIRVCKGFARRWGYARLRMMNLYALRSTDPSVLWQAGDPVGPENDHHLSLAFGGSDLVVAAWGMNARPDRLARFSEVFAGWPLWCLGCTRDGFPRHPLRIPTTQQPQPFNDVAARVPAVRPPGNPE